MKFKIREKVIAIMVVLIMIPIVILGCTFYNSSTKATKQQYGELGTVIGKQAQTLVESQVYDNNKLVEDLSLDPLLRDLSDPDNVDRLLEKFRRTKDSYEFLDIYFGTSEGQVHIASGADTTGVIPQERPWYIKANEEDGVAWSEVYEDKTTGNNIITISKAVYDGDILKGVIGIDIDLANFSKIITKVDIMGGYPIVMDGDGTILVDKDEKWVGKPFQGIEQFDINSKETQVIESTFNDTVNNVVKEQLIVFSPIEGTSWKVAAIIGLDALKVLNANMIKSIIFVSTLTIIIGVLTAVVFGRQISNSINKVLMAIRKMEQGDFTTRIETKNSDEFGEVRDSFNKMMETLCMFIGKIKASSVSVDEYSGNLAAISEEVSASSLEVSRTAEEIAKGASSQADDTESGVALISQLSDKLVELGATSGDMVSLAEEIRATSRESSQVVDNLREKTDLNNESSKRVEEEIMELDRQISEVTNILSTIDAIAEQTNLLALNASIEAARAGESGKGFAVVAEEIRKLAGESKESSNNIKSIVDAVQLESKATVEVVGEVNSRNEEQTEAVAKVNESFETINSLITQIVSKISDIDNQSSAMNNDRDEIVSSIENISAISQQTAAASEEVTASIEQQTAATEEVATSAGKLNELSHELNNEISVFKI